VSGGDATYRQLLQVIGEQTLELRAHAAHEDELGRALLERTAALDAALAELEDLKANRAAVPHGGEGP
jgi:hypothetical protein